MNSRPTATDNPTSKGVSRRNVMKGLMSGLVGAGLMPRVTRGAPVAGLLSDSGPDILWDIAAPDPSRYSFYALPAYIGGSIVFSMQDQDTFQGALFWLDVQSQQYRGPIEFDHFLFTPVLLNGILYAAGNTGGLYALDAVSGKSLWPKPAPYRIAADVVSIHSQLVFPTTDGHIVALDTNGNQLWSYSTGQSVGAYQASSATLLNGVVLVAYYSTLYAVDANTGAFLWKYSATDEILGDIAVSSNGVHFSTRDQKVWGVKPDGTLSWNWPPANSPVGAPLGSPLVNAEVVYVADGNGNFYAFNALNGTLNWHIMLTTGASRAPIFVEDGVAYVSAGLLTGDNTLYAIDLTSNGGKVISQDIGKFGQFVGVENGVAYYTHNNQNNIAASNFAGQLHQFFCESQLMAEDYVSSGNSNGYAGNTTSYRTHLQLLDPNYNPRVYKTVKIWASDTATLTSGGQTYTIDNNGNSAMLQTDGLGELSLVVTATDLTCPALYLWGNFMETGESLVVYPDNDSLAQLSQVTGGSLQKATDYQGNPLLADSSSADALANTIVNAMAGGPPQNPVKAQNSAQLQTIVPSQNNGHRRRPILRNGNSFMAYPGQTPNLWYFPNSTASTDRPYGTAATPNWQATFGENGISFSPTCDSCTGVEQLLGLSFHDLLKNVVHGVENVAKIVYTTVEKVVTVVVTTAENVYNVTVTAVEHAAAVVAAAIKTAVKDINRAIQFLSYLFQWGDILKTKDVIKTDLSSAFSNWKTWLAAQQANNFGGLHSGLQGLSVGSSLASPPQSLSGSIQSQQVDNNNPQDLYNMGGSKSKSYNQSRFLTTKVQDNAAQGQVTSVSAVALGSSSDTFIGAVETFFNTVQSQLTNNTSFQSLPTDVLNTFANFKNLFTDPSQFVTNSMADISKLIKDIAGTIVALADAVIEGLVQLLLTVIDIITDLLNTTITIPFVSDLYQTIAKSPLTILDLCALIIAIPAHIITAAMSGGPSQTQAQTIGAAPTPEKVDWFVSCGMQAIFFSLGDLLAVKPSSLFGSIIAGINCFVLGFGFPLDFATNTDFTYIYYSIKGIPPLLGIFNSIGSTAKFALAIRTATPYVLCVQGMATLAMAIVFAAALQKPAFIGHEYMQLAVNGAQDVPFLIKPLANGDASSPQRIAAALIDGVMFAGALGVAIAQQVLE